MMRNHVEDLMDKAYYVKSDRGVQYACGDYIAILRHNGILPSMAEDGNLKDNAIAERVNGIIKNELMQGMRFSSIQEVRKAVAAAVHYSNLPPTQSLTKPHS